MDNVNKKAKSTTIELMEDKEYGQYDGVTTTDLGMYCRDLWTEYSTSTYRRKKLDEIYEGRKRYRNSRKTKNFPWKNCSNKSLGLEAIAIDNLEPRVFNRLIGEEDFIQIAPTNKDDVPKVSKCKEFLLWATLNNMQIRKSLKPIIHDLLMDGTKDVICFWEEKEEYTKKREYIPVFIDPLGREITIPQETFQGQNPQVVLQQLMAAGIRPAGSKEVVKGQMQRVFKCVMEGLKIEDCFYPDHNYMWDEQPFMRYIYPTLRELKDLNEAGVYKNIGNDLVEAGARATTDDEQEKDISYSLYTQECKLIECYVKWEGEWVIATFSPTAGWREVRHQKLIDIYWHGHKPIRRFTIYPESNESMGVGIPRKIEQLSKGQNDLFNQMIDNATMEVMPYFFYNKSAAGMESIQRKLFPGAGVGLPKDSRVFFPNSGVKSPVFIEFINLLLTFFERTLSLMDYSSGTRSSTTGQGGDTASGMQMILQEGNIKHNYTGEHLQDTFADILKDILSLYAQYMPLDSQMRISGKDGWTFKGVDVAALQGEFDIRVEVSNASSNTMTNRNEKLTLYQILKGSPVVNQEKITVDLLKAFGHKGIEEYIAQNYQLVTQALQADPEGTMQMLQQHLQEVSQQQDQEKIKSEAEHNIMRQKIERQVEQPYENEKLVDQANENYKRNITQKVIEGIGGLPQ